MKDYYGNQKIDFSNFFIMGEEIPTCSFCGCRTEIIFELPDSMNQIQIHKCLSNICHFEFVLVLDLEISKIYEKGSETLD